MTAGPVAPVNRTGFVLPSRAMSRLEKSAMSQSTSTPVPYSLDRKVRAVLRPSKVPVLKAVDLERTGHVHRATVKFRDKYFSANAAGRQTCKPLPRPIPVNISKEQMQPCSTGARFCKIGWFNQVA